MIVTEIATTLALALLAAGITRIALTVWPLRGTKLPDPAEIGLPVAGHASPAAAHAAINRKKV